MTRIALALATTAAVVAVASGTAGASGGQVTRDWFHGPFAEASWETSSGDSVTDGGVLASREQNGTTHLSLDLFKMEQGTYRLNPKPLDIRQVAERAILDLRALIRTREVSCEVVTKDLGDPRPMLG